MGHRLTVQVCRTSAPESTSTLGPWGRAPDFRFRVTDIARERDRILREASPSYATAIQRFEGLVALCDFLDPWGNSFGLYQVLFEGREPSRLAGSNREHMTEVEKRIADGPRLALES